MSALAIVDVIDTMIVARARERERHRGRVRSSVDDKTVDVIAPIDD